MFKNPAWNLKGKSLPGNREKGGPPLALPAGKKSLFFPFIKASVIYEIRGRPLSKDFQRLPGNRKKKKQDK